MTRRLVAAVLAGAATGSRSMIGLGVLALSTSASATGQPDRTLHRVRAVAALAAAGELVGDKLPQAPSRLEPPGLAARLLAAAACAQIVSRRGTRSPGALPTVLSVATAAGTARLGSAWRGWCAQRVGADWVGACAEDALALGLAAGAAALVR